MTIEKRTRKQILDSFTSLYLDIDKFKILYRLTVYREHLGNIITLENILSVPFNTYEECIDMLNNYEKIKYFVKEKKGTRIMAHIDACFFDTKYMREVGPSQRISSIPYSAVIKAWDRMVAP